MERRRFLKFAVGFAAGAAALTAGAQAAPLSPLQLGRDEGLPPSKQDIHPAVTSDAEVEHLKPEQVHWGHHHGHGHRWGWHHRHWGWRHRHWRRWHHRHWW